MRANHEQPMDVAKKMGDALVEAVPDKISQCSEKKCWFIFANIIVIGFKFFSSQRFSGLVTLSAAFQAFAFFLLFYKLVTQKTAHGVSSRSLQLYLPVFIFRLSSTLFYNGYVPGDKSGDWAYQVCDIASLIMVCTMLFLIHTKYNRSYLQEYDQFPISGIVGTCSLLALLVHPTNNRFLPTDWAWACSTYIEALAILPQLYMMTKLGEKVEALTSHYVFCMSISRFLSLFYWACSYRLLGPRVLSAKGTLKLVKGTWNFAGYACLLAHLIETLLFVDFVHQYFTALRSRGITKLSTMTVSV